MACVAAPALMAATVGVAFGSQHDITTEAGDALILETTLGKIDELIHIGRRMRASRCKVRWEEWPPAFSVWRQRHSAICHRLPARLDRKSWICWPC